MSSNGPNPAQVMSLKSLHDFLMHGVVLQNRVFRSVRAMFHVKHFCVNADFARGLYSRRRMKIPALSQA